MPAGRANSPLRRRRGYTEELKGWWSSVLRRRAAAPADWPNARDVFRRSGRFAQLIELLGEAGDGPQSDRAVPSVHDWCCQR
jgi:hypothetical protein